MREKERLLNLNYQLQKDTPISWIEEEGVNKDDNKKKLLHSPVSYINSVAFS